jgi:hypothetical protein
MGRDDESHSAQGHGSFHHRLVDLDDRHARWSEGCLDLVFRENAERLLGEGKA